MTDMKLSLIHICQNMLPQQVVTRSAIAKDDKEKRINQLYLFFFDKNGNYLESTNEKVFLPRCV